MTLIRYIKYGRGDIMKIINGKNYRRKLIEDLEIETFEEYVPGDYYGEDVLSMFNPDKQFSILNKSIYYRKGDTNYFAEDVTSDTIIECTEMLDKDDIIAITESSVLFIMTKDEFIQLGKYIDEYDKGYQELEDMKKEANYYSYDYDKEYRLEPQPDPSQNTLKNFHKLIMDKLTYKKNEVHRHIEDKKAETEGTTDMQKLAAEFDEIGVYKKDFITIYKDEVRLKSNAVTDHEFVFNLHHHLTGLQVSRLDRDINNVTVDTDEKILDYVESFVRGLSWTIDWKGKEFIHTIVRDKFKVKWNKTKTWTIRTDTHRKIINLQNFEDSISLLEFYEDSTKPAGEYYKRVRLDNDNDTILPATFKRVKGNEYLITIMDDIEIKRCLYITNNKVKAFDWIRQEDYTYDLNTKELYKKLLNKMDKSEALAKLKTMKAVINL